MLGFPSGFSWISFRPGLDFLPKEFGFASGGFGNLIALARRPHASRLAFPHP
jgi:hypothetical protein